MKTSTHHDYGTSYQCLYAVLVALLGQNVTQKVGDDSAWALIGRLKEVGYIEEE